MIHDAGPPVVTAGRKRKGKPRLDNIISHARITFNASPPNPEIHRRVLQRIVEGEAARNKQRTEQANNREATNLAEEVRNVRPKQSAVQDSTRVANEPPCRHLNDPELASARVPVKRPQPGTPGAGAAAGSEVKARKAEGPANEVTVESSSSPCVEGGAKRHAVDRSKEDEAAAKQPRIHTDGL